VARSSKLRAQRCLSSRTSINWAVIRTLSPRRTTDPSTTASTSTSRAICRSGFLTSSSCITDVRETTRRLGMVASSVMSSSVISSAKYSWLRSRAGLLRPRYYIRLGLLLFIEGGVLRSRSIVLWVFRCYELNTGLRFFERIGHFYSFRNLNFAGTANPLSGQRLEKAESVLSIFSTRLKDYQLRGGHAPGPDHRRTEMRRIVGGVRLRSGARRLELSKGSMRLYWYLAAVMLATVVAMLAVGGRPDPAGLAVVLDGNWTFHAGDDLRWADPNWNDSAWDHMNLVSDERMHDPDVGLPGWLPGWHARGYPDLAGYGWYRRRVALPPQSDLALLGPTMVDDGYAMYWNGQLVGGVGRLDAKPKVGGTRPYLVMVPRRTDERSAVLAIRTYMERGIGRDNQSGGLRSAPVLAEGRSAQKLHAAEWRRTIAGYIVEVALPVMMVLLATIALIVASSLPRPGFARWLSVALLATAALRFGNAVSSWTDLIGLLTLDSLNSILLSPLAMLAGTAAWNDWVNDRFHRPVLSIATAAWAMRVFGTAVKMDDLVTVARVIFIVLFVTIAVRITPRRESRFLALLTMLVVATALFITELSRLGVPTIWFPFNIGVTLTQYAYALALILLPLALQMPGEKGLIEIGAQQPA
jgi:hypothetical protein